LEHVILSDKGIRCVWKFREQRFDPLRVEHDKIKEQWATQRQQLLDVIDTREC
jgi:hypothetical protein